jgi:hypothetical protein
MIAPRSKKEVERSATYARGGKGPVNRMLPELPAGPARPGITGKNKTLAPGATKAIGGAKTSRSPSLAMPAKGGHTAPLRKGR